MKIVKFNEFVKMPAGTIFSYYEPHVTRGLYRKGESIAYDGELSDFYEAPVMAESWNLCEPVVDDTECRWGMFDYDEMYAIYEEEDIVKMIEMLTGNVEKI